MSISQSAFQCIKSLDTKAATINPRLRLELENPLVRFKVWAGNIRVFAPGNASLNFRLRDDDDVSDVLQVLLRRLRELVETALRPPIEEENEADDGAETLEPLSDASDSSSSLSFDVDEPSEPPALQQDPMVKANEILDDLYRLTSILKKPASSNENARVKAFIAKDVDDEEREARQEFESYIRFMIQSHYFPKAPKFLTERLVSAVIFRRMILLYRQRHHAKISQTVDQDQLSEMPEQPTTGIESHTRATHNKIKKGSALPMATISGVRTTALSETNASSVNKSGLANYAKSVAMSGITAAHAARRKVLDVPLPPDKIDERSQKVFCQYCSRWISKSDTKEPRWT